MKVSAWNRFFGRVVTKREGPLAAIVGVSVPELSCTVNALISLEALSEAQLQVGSDVFVQFSESDVLLAQGVSAEGGNAVVCKVTSVLTGVTNDLIVLKADGGGTVFARSPRTSTELMGLSTGDYVSTMVRPVDVMLSTSGELTSSIFILNTPDNLNNPFIGLAGHAALLFELPNGAVELFSFSPYDNQSPSADGAVASTGRPTPSIEVFKAECMRNDRQGITIGNRYMDWHERFARMIRLTVMPSQWRAALRYANAIAQNPPEYDVVNYNCQVFCNLALGSAGIVLRDRFGYAFDSIVPNVVYEEATGALNVLSFEKADFERSQS